MVRITPMFQQYLSIKQEVPDAILFFRMGDFYEMFFEDAEVAAPILQIALTSRNKDEANAVPMCGVPHHSASAYITKLVEQGYKVAVCDQVEDPRDAKGVVKRAITRVITPGVQVDTDALEEDVSNYVAAVACIGDAYGLAYMDVSTGDFRVTGMDAAQKLLDELGRISAAELLVPEDIDFGSGQERFDMETAEVVKNVRPSGELDAREAESLLKRQFGVETLDGFGLENVPEQVLAAAYVLNYVLGTQRRDLSHVTDILAYRVSDTMILDESAKRNLEILESIQRKGRKGSLLEVLDQTRTAMGARRLREWICYPLIKKRPISLRLDAVQELRDRLTEREQLREQLKRVHDLERLNSKVAMGRANPRDLIALRDSLELIPAFRDSLSESGSTLLKRLREGLDPLEDVIEIIRNAIRDDAPVNVGQGGVIREGVHPELDTYITVTRDSREWIVALENQERASTGISSLKVGYNKVFGYYIEVTRPHIDKVPDTYIRKQTLVNAERYVTPELKDRETLILEAQEKRTQLEYDLFVSVREEVAARGKRIRSVARVLADLDVICSLAHVAHHHNYVRPEIEDHGEIRIEGARHPVVEQTIAAGDFVPNDLTLDMDEEQILIITGPNMAGKSTVLRQAALIVLMAQMGSFVPASNARIGIVDRIFTRIGASDDLYRGHSTFMVEMIETARIVHQSTPRSLLILDEIGRGTSTFDGVSIAWSVIEYLHERRGQGVKTLFATHYHELTALARLLPRVRNYNIAVKEWQGRVLFLRKMVRGGASHSYGIEVARLAGLPKTIIERGREILEQLEAGGLPELEECSPIRRSRKAAHKQVPMEFFEEQPSMLQKRMDELNPDDLTPMEALKILYELKRLAQEK